MAAPTRKDYGLFASQRRMRRDATEYEQARQDVITGLQTREDRILANVADPAEAAAMREEYDGYIDLARSADELQQREGFAGLSKMGAAVQASVDRRHKAQQDFIIEQSRDLREQHQKATAPMRQLQANMEQLNDLLDDPAWEQNKAANRGTLIGLLDSTTRQMLADPADFADSLRMAGGSLGLINALIGFAAGEIDRQDFDMKKDEYATLARAMYISNQRRYASTVAPLELEAAALDKAATGLEFLTPGYSLTQYVTGGTDAEQFTNPIKEHYLDTSPQQGPAIPPLEQVTSAAGELGNAALNFLEGDQGGGDPQRALAGPQFAGVPESQVGLLDRGVGYGSVVSGLNKRIFEASAEGTVRVDAKTGNLYIEHDDGREPTPIKTNSMERSFILRSLEGGSRTSVRGRLPARAP